jgi:hypothetical protein
MQLYSYQIRLRIWHSTIDPELITKNLGIQPNVSAKVGQPRTTPKGNRLDGTYAESYWSGIPFDRMEYCSVDDLAEDAISDVIGYLEPHAKFLNRLHADGGRLLLEICSYGSRNYAFEFSPELLKRISSIGISLVHDVYPVQQNW